MRFGEALKEAVKYHAVAIIPTLIGVGIAFGSLWIGVIEPFLGAIAGELGEPTVALERAAEAEYSFAIAVIGVVVGLLIRRIGRTALLFRTHGNAVVEEVDREVIPDEFTKEDTSGTAASDGSAETHSEARTVADAATGDDTATGDDATDADDKSDPVDESEAVNEGVDTPTTPATTDDESHDAPSNEENEELEDDKSGTSEDDEGDTVDDGEETGRRDR